MDSYNLTDEEIDEIYSPKVAKLLKAPITEDAEYQGLKEDIKKFGDVVQKYLKSKRDSISIKGEIMNEYKKLLVLLSAIENLEGTTIPINIIKENLNPLRKFVEDRIKELEALPQNDLK